MNNRRNAYTEVYTILQDLDEEEYNKIPPEVIKAIEEMDKPAAERLELMINLKHYLHPDKYEENNKVLNKKQKMI